MRDVYIFVIGRSAADIAGEFWSYDEFLFLVHPSVLSDYRLSWIVSNKFVYAVNSRVSAKKVR